VREGDVRTVSTEGFDLEIDETEFEHDDPQMKFSYGVTAMRGETLLDLGAGRTLDLGSMVGHHRATMRVIPVDHSTSKVVYTLDLDDGHDQTLESTSGQYQAVLDRLKHRLEQSPASELRG
jgi:hypothetical protein